jgi:hypothetical protein
LAGRHVATRYILIVAAAAMCFAARAQALPATFEEALQLAQQRNKSAPTLEYHRGPFMAYFGPRYAAVFNDCMRTHPLRERLVFVLALDAEGKLARVYSNHASPLVRCAEDQLARDRFPRPPVAPYFTEFRIEMPPK